ncbi:MAG: septum site-determining protein MinC [Neisseriaceae bacterium]
MNTFEVKSAQVNALSLLLKSLDLDAVQAEFLASVDRIRPLCALPFMLDLSHCEASLLSRDSIGRLISFLKTLKLNMIGIIHHDETLAPMADSLGLPFQLLAKSKKQHLTSSFQTSTPQKDEAGFIPTVRIERPVRSGQQIYAKNGDLIITSLVSEGAEVVADGNVHIYAPARGRVFAGASGDINARIFIFSMQAQLVCIAGVYRIFDQSLPNTLYKQPVSISLLGNKLAITAIRT